MPGGFRIQSVAIEGFKGFTTRQVIDLDGRHAFLLGQNGNGKSSIVEAIRWGLFGSSRRPNEVVVNRGYHLGCSVEITLLRDGRRWNLHRTLRRGAGGVSGAVLRDENRRVHLVGEIMPQLESADAGEGMHIIFAPQGTTLHRQPEDLSPFERTVFRYLGLASPRAFLDQLRDFVREQEDVQNALGQQITDESSAIDKRISDLESQRGIIVSASPWGGTAIPTVAESENKVRSLIVEITGRQPDDSLAGASLDALIEGADDALKAKRAQDQSDLRNEVGYNKERLSNLDALQEIYEDIKGHQARSQEVESRLDGVLSGISIDELRNHIAQVQDEKDALDLRRKIVDEAVSWVSRGEDNITVCPVCETEHSRGDLESMLRRISAQLPEEVDSTLSQLEARLSQAEELTRQIQHLAEELDALVKDAKEAHEELSNEDFDALPEPVSVHQIEAVKSRINEHKISLESQISDQDGWFNAITLRLANLKQEERLHRLNKELTERRQSKQRLVRVEEAHDALVWFGESVKAISRAVETHLDERIAAGIPVVSDNLSKAFAALARHPWYDRLAIVKGAQTRLQMRVASSQDPLNEDPIGVLNGQAERAAELAPYFAFSQNEEAPTEVYLVMLDDPTRAFDEEHTGVLVQRLAELGQNVQLIVASQETTRFRELLPENFAPASYVIVEPTRWSRDSGPQLLIERE